MFLQHILNITFISITLEELLLHSTQAIKDMTEEFQNFTFMDIESHEAKSFQEDLQTSELKFVTPDSSNLVFEALSCKGKTYVMQIERLARI